MIDEASGVTPLASLEMMALPFWAGRSREAQFLCREFTRIFAKNLKNSCEFAKFVAEVLDLPVKNSRAAIINDASGVTLPASLGMFNEAGGIIVRRL
jgi:hypothetical protein